MKALVRIAFGTSLFALIAAMPVSANDGMRARGDFTAVIDFSTLTLTAVGNRCLLVVEGVVNLTGTLEGIAPAKTRALVEAVCPDVATAAPGTYEDVFTAELEVAGTVNGAPTVADITYRGNTAVGGDIDGVMVLSNGIAGVLKVDALVAVGGSYRGFVSR